MFIVLQAKEHIVVIFKKEVSKGELFVHLHRNNFQKKIKCTELNALTYTFKPEGKIYRMLIAFQLYFFYLCYILEIQMYN